MLETALNEREVILASTGEKAFTPIMESDEPEYKSQAIAPIICQGDVIGSVAMLGKDERARMGELEKKLVLTAAGFLGRQMEG